MERSIVLIILLLSGSLIPGAIARGDQDRDELYDENIKEMTYGDVAEILAGNNTETNNSSFDVVDENIIDEEMNADDPSQDKVKTNWMIIGLCCLAAFILILLAVGSVLCRKGKQVFVLPFLVLNLHSISQSRQGK